MENKTLKQMENDLMKILGCNVSIKDNTKKKKFVPKYQNTTYGGKTIKWYLNSSNNIKIVNGKELDWLILKDEYDKPEDVIIDYIKKHLESEDK